MIVMGRNLTWIHVFLLFQLLPVNAAGPQGGTIQGLQSRIVSEYKVHNTDIVPPVVAVRYVPMRPITSNS